MAISKSRRNNLLFLVVIALLLIPQTRQPIQIFIHKGLALFSPSVINKDKSKVLTNYNWRLQDVNNKAINLNEFKGQVVFVNLWATWCPPCIAEMPSIQELYKDYKNDIVFLMISDENSEVIKRFLEKHDYNFEVQQPLSDSPERLKSKSIPRTFLIDKGGNIIINKSGAANWNSNKVRETINSLLN